MQGHVHGEEDLGKPSIIVATKSVISIRSSASTELSNHSTSEAASAYEASTKAAAQRSRSVAGVTCDYRTSSLALRILLFMIGAGQGAS